MKLCRCAKPIPLARPSGDTICAECGCRVLPKNDSLIARA